MDGNTEILIVRPALGIFMSHLSYFKLKTIKRFRALVFT